MPKVVLDLAQAEREEVNPDPLVFEIDGQDYTCQDELAEFALMDLAQKADSQDAMEAGAAFMNFLQTILIPEDWDRFRQNAIKNKWTTLQMLPLVQQAVEAMVGVPTLPPSESPSGQPPTGTPSRVVSL